MYYLIHFVQLICFIYYLFLKNFFSSSDVYLDKYNKMRFLKSPDRTAHTQPKKYGRQVTIKVVFGPIFCWRNPDKIHTKGLMTFSNETRISKLQFFYFTFVLIMIEITYPRFLIICNWKKCTIHGQLRGCYCRITTAHPII